ncbi:STE3-domain-containing protein [Punctularia strigosozonata HHB-11173 SS5]|uniref:STE3-domain-containing protein n=1 Tax=Punctularia strigosozonata (strain HHB-11173) TaxID=741275 RepID=UPI0004418458|nr:STE3-domain-containing protein [Punctularia strigosozonata HHB-11173 SS5]EIN05670.1 STE3-domain-containing protein [Punctularia strigosozonata HHB-11173 SS5]
MAYPNEVFSAFAFISFVLVLIPFRWHLEAWNTGTCMYMAWTAIGCLYLFINSIVWKGNAEIHSLVWCDISSHLQVALNTAIPAASLCINRRLYHIASVSSVTSTRSDKRRAIVIDLLIGVGIPILGMIVYIIPQGHRGDILEDIGPVAEVYNTWVAYVLFSSWPVVIGLVSAVYCIMTLRLFAKRRSQFKQLLATNKNLNMSRYFRLMALAGVELVCTVPLASYIIYLDVTVLPVNPWISWADTHSNFNRYDQYPSVIWRADPRNQALHELTRWSVVICALVFFAFFGFADEAQKQYRSLASSVGNRLGVSATFSKLSFLTSKSSGTTSTTNGSVLPVFITQERSVFKNDSFTASKMSTTASFNDRDCDLDSLDDIKGQPFGPQSPVSEKVPEVTVDPTPRRPSVVSLDDEQARIAFSGGQMIGGLSTV